jgi:hypothetical protein
VVVQHPFGRMRTAQQLADTHTVKPSRTQGLKHRADEAVAGSDLIFG